MTVESKKKKSKAKIAGIVVGSILALVVVVVGASYWYIHSKYSKMNLATNDGSDITQATEEELKEDDLITENGQLVNSDKEEIQEVLDNVNNAVDNSTTPVAESDSVYNVMFLGGDSRNTTSRGRTDSMMLVSINDTKKTIEVTSILRDVFVKIDGHGTDRLNTAYIFGGAPLLFKTIEDNFRIKVDQFVYVNFFSFIDIIDAMDGITLSITDAELPYVNGYLDETCNIQGIDPEPFYLDKAGTQHVNGTQALAYSRIRYIGTDFARTQRQRNVMEKVFEKAKSMSVFQLNSFADKVLPEVTTNISEGKLISLLLNAPSLLGYTVNQHTIPIEGAYKFATIDGKSVISIDFEKNNSFLHKTIYGD